MRALLDSLDDAQYLVLNSTMLPLQGVGADNFFLNESLPEDKTMLDFDTLGDYASESSAMATIYRPLSACRSVVNGRKSLCGSSGSGMNPKRR